MEYDLLRSVVICSRWLTSSSWVVWHQWLPNCYLILSYYNDTLGTYNYLFYFFTDHFVYRLRRIFSDCWNEVHQIWSYRRPHDWWLSMAKEEFDTFSPPRCGVNEVEAADMKSFLLRSFKTWGMSFAVLESSIACHTETASSQTPSCSSLHLCLIFIRAFLTIVPQDTVFLLRDPLPFSPTHSNSDETKHC